MDVKSEPIRVCVYARVSTDSDDQLNSLENQKAIYEEKVKSNPDWAFAGIYADPGITGTTDDRPEFQRMLRDAKRHCFDRIICKSISRFARNTLISLQTIRDLSELGISIFFEKENIDTAHVFSELMLTVYSAFAQEESRNNSERTKRGLRMHWANGQVKWSPLYGYTRTEDREYVIVEDEAEVVRRIFDSYERGKSCKVIADELTADGIASSAGAKWDNVSVNLVVHNEKYAGDILTGKHYTKDHLSRKRVTNKGEVEQFLLKDHHEPIISREQFDRCQKISKIKLSGEYPFHREMLECPHCGERLVFRAQYIRAVGSVWCCEKDEFYVPVKSLLTAALEAWNATTDPSATALKVAYPTMSSVDFWWVDRVISKIRFGTHSGPDDQTITIYFTGGTSLTVPSNIGLMEKLASRRRKMERRKAVIQGERRVEVWKTAPIQPYAVYTS